MSSPPAYERDPWLRELETRIVSVGDEHGRPWAELDDSILYPEGGGQPADRGWLGETAVVDVQWRGGRARHYLERTLEPGSVRVRLDWRRRFDHMQQHSAQHLLSALAEDRHGWATTAFHLGAELSDVELAVPSLTAGQLGELEELVAEHVRAAHPIRPRRVSPEDYARLAVRSRGLPEGHSGDVRLVEIEGVDLNTCGGTHLGCTSQIEALALVGAEPMRGGTRVHFLAGARLRRRLAVHERRNAELRSLLGVGDGELVQAVTARVERSREAERSVRKLAEQLAEARAETLAAGDSRLVEAHFPDQDMVFLQRLARRLGELAPERVALLTAGAEQPVFVLAAGPDSGADPRALGAGVAERLGGRGGGAGAVFQGRAARLDGREVALAWLAEELAGPSDRR